MASTRLRRASREGHHRAGAAPGGGRARREEKLDVRGAVREVEGLSRFEQDVERSSGRLAPREVRGAKGLPGSGARGGIRRTPRSLRLSRRAWGSKGSNIRAASPAKEASGSIAEQAVGRPAARASSKGRPKPSKVEGQRNAQASRKSAYSSSRGSQPVRRDRILEPKFGDEALEGRGKESPETRNDQPELGPRAPPIREGPDERP